MKKIFFQGAEAIIKKQKNAVIKDRIAKSYRHPILDTKLRKQRTKKEIKLLEKTSKVISVPKIISTSEYQIVLKEIKGKKLADNFDKLPNKLTVAKQIGTSIAKIHDTNIIHGDLTTSNMIYAKKVYLIDFGLGYESNSVEHKAVDLHVLKEALIAKHPKSSDSCFSAIINGYKTSKNASAVLKRLEKVELRGRYKQQY